MKMPQVLHCLAALPLLMLLSLPEKQGGEARAIICCLRTTNTKVHVNQLDDYKSQMTPLCPVNALRFKTKMGNTICSDPTSSWAIRAKNYLDKKRSPQPTGAQITSQQTTTLRPEFQSNSTGTNGTLFHV